MIRKDLYNLIDLLAEEKELDKEVVEQAFVEALEHGCAKAHDVKSCRVQLREEKNEIRVFTQRLVVEDYSLDSDKNFTQILWKDAKKEKARVKVGEILEVEIDPQQFGHFAIRDFKNKLNEIIVNAQKTTIYDYFKQLEGNIISARVIDSENDYYRLDIGKDMTTILPKKDTLEKDNFHISDHVKLYVTQVDKPGKAGKKSKWPKVFVTRTHPQFVAKLMETNVPEIREGVIEIISVARDAGDRSKVAVFSHNPKIEPVGACIGEGGSRIRNVVKTLSEEKIDVFRWSDNERDLIKEALKPATVVAVTDVNPVDKTALAIVPDNQLSLAIGKLGQNVKLAVQATGWSIDIKSESIALEEGILY